MMKINVNQVVFFFTFFFKKKHESLFSFCYEVLVDFVSICVFMGRSSGY
jgi:hypothetical protein